MLCISVSSTSRMLVVLDTGGRKALTIRQAKWDALEAAGALNSTQWPSWKTWDKLDRRVKRDRLQCRNGVAVAEKGNPMQT